MFRTKSFRFQPTVLIIAILAAFTPAASWSLDLVQEPPLPTSKSAFVAPNVIISIDDSGSMDYCSNAESETNCIKNINNSNRTSTPVYSCQTGYTLYSSTNCRSSTSDNTKRSGRNNNYTCSTGYILNGNNCYQQDNSQLINTPKYSCPSRFSLDADTNNCYTWGGASNETSPTNGVWPVTSRRINVLKYSLNKVFSDKELIPDGKIRLAWQVMHANGNTTAEKSVDSATLKTNSMRPIKGGTTETGTHRKNFIDFVGKLSPNNGTPSHTMFSQADAYMRRSLSASGPWSTDPGGTGSKSTEYLGCRRNYHIMMTDGRWTGTATGDQQDGKNWDASGKRAAYSTTSNQTQIYRDNEQSTLADWAFKSWMDPLQDATKLKDSANLNPSRVYEEAAEYELFSLKIGNQTKSVNLAKYWNPKYNPATWPHMVTYTIGFSESAIEWPGAPGIIRPSLVAATSDTEQGGYLGYDNSFIDLITGWQTWPTMNRTNTGNETVGQEVRSLDLWHASINGRGRFYPVTQGEDLEKAFRAIIGKINEESAPLPDSIAGGGSTSGYNVSQNNAGIFASVYSPKDGWSGYITATRAIEPEEYACPTTEDPEKKCIRFKDVISGWEGKSTADRLDGLASVDNRLVLSWSDSSNAGIPFQWASSTTPIGYSASQLNTLLETTGTTALTAPQKTQAQNIINYIRGDKSLEGITAEKPLRVRHSRQGDVVNSEIWYTGSPISNYAMGYSTFAKAQKGRTPVLYVGGNDGMLHGFSAKDGKELLAYVPRGVVSKLKKLTDKDYQHQYYVDGSPMTGDIKDGTDWKTLLVGTLGAGGKGYFILDVTNPTGFAGASASDLVLQDRTRANNEVISCTGLSGSALATCNENNDIGNITAQPGRNPANLQEATQITRMNNGRWAVVMGNGYNSANQRPVLLVQYLDGDKSLQRIQATAALPGQGNAADNGLSHPALVDLNGDGMADIAYAGDNLGNLWKFDLMSSDASEWKVAFEAMDKPLFIARGPIALKGTRNQIQPITAPPSVRANDRYKIDGTKSVPIGGMMVAFGTGRNLTMNDRRTDVTQNVQTLYAVLDNARYRTKSGTTHLEVHPGQTCPTNPTIPCTNVPAPAVVGTISATGSPLAQQSIKQVAGDYATIVPETAEQSLNPNTWGNFKGWYLDFRATGQRLLKPMQFFDGSNILAVYSETPSGIKNSMSDNINESCVPVKVDTSAGSQFRTLINIMDGKRPSIQLIDYNGDGIYNDADLDIAEAPVPTGTPILITEPNNIVDLTGGGGGRDTLARMPENSVRPSWRQLR